MSDSCVLYEVGIPITVDWMLAGVRTYMRCAESLTSRALDFNVSSTDLGSCFRHQVFNLTALLVDGCERDRGGLGNRYERKADNKGKRLAGWQREGCLVPTGRWVGAGVRAGAGGGTRTGARNPIWIQASFSPCKKFAESAVCNEERVSVYQTSTDQTKFQETAINSTNSS